ncbi:hypothetical protein SKAU_G00141140 [Synaphobranchus kaupii]|uniref:Uncharacterized protein n=1 Tax=Synaphobranchus kaupii TaxID=118154 RepID=A0A9Q1J497_SYNKA|nr:hypothetical protein SKAU_G00141140 [Synaphobranchus kaupii]
MHLELQSNIMQEKLDAKDLSQDTGSTLQTSDSEHHDKESEVKDVIQSKKQTKETEQERKKTDAILKIHISARIAERTLAAESKDNAILRQKIIEVRAQLSEIQNPAFAPPLKKEKIKKMESDQASLNGEKTNLENLCKILEEKFQIMHNLCEQKDSALEQKLVEEKLEQHVKEIKSGGRKEEIRNFKLSEASAKVAGYQEPLTEALSRSDRQIRPLRKYGAVPTKNVNTVDKSEGSSAVAVLDKFYWGGPSQHRGHHRGQGHLDRGTGPCRPPCKTATAAQGDSECRDKELKVKDVLKTHNLKVQAIQEQHQKSELAYMAETQVKLPNAVEEERNLYLEKLQLEEKKTHQLEEKIQTLEQDMDALKSEKFQLDNQTTALQSEVYIMNELCLQKDQALQQNTMQVEVEHIVMVAEIQALTLRMRVMEEELEKSQCCYMAQVKIAREVEEERNLYLERLQLDEEKTHQLEGKPPPIQTFTLTSHVNQLCPRGLQFLCCWWDYQCLDSEDIPLLEQTETRSPEVSTPSSSSGTHLDRPFRSLLEVEDLHPTQVPRRL